MTCKYFKTYKKTFKNSALNTCIPFSEIQTCFAMFTVSSSTIFFFLLILLRFGCDILTCYP